MAHASFVLVTFLKPLHKGVAFPKSEWPPHITIVPPFSIRLTDALEQELRELVAAQPAFRAEFGGEAMFGPRKKIPVQLIRKSRQFDALHLGLMRVLESHGAKFKSRKHANDRFRPHVRRKGGERLQPGQRITIDAVALVHRASDQDGGTRTVEQVFPLGSAGRR